MTASSPPPPIDDASPLAVEDEELVQEWLSLRDFVPHRFHYTADERALVFDELFPPGTAWMPGFALMMAMSTLIASLGLRADSATLVIGAMLIAPLMRPVLAAGAALGEGEWRRFLSAVTTTVASTAGAIAMAWVISRFLPATSRVDLGDEILSRTSPDIRVLLIALGAGVAGAYASARPDTSSSLPGVAVAVALVPPIAVVGVALEAGRADLASGAFLLYITNLLCIVVAAIVVFMSIGLVPLPHLVPTTRRLGLAAIFVAVLVIAYPLINAFADATSSAQLRSQINDQVIRWLGDQRTEVTNIDIDLPRVQVDLRGFERPPSVEELASQLGGLLGTTIELEVRLQQIDERQTTGEQDRLNSQVTDLVEAWLSRASPTGEHTLDNVSADLASGMVTVQLTGPAPAPSPELLRAAVVSDYGEEFGADFLVEVLLNEVVVSTADGSGGSLRTRAAQTAESWLADSGVLGLEIVDLRVSEAGIVVELIGPSAPKVESLIDRIHAEIDAELDVTFLFIQRDSLTIGPDAAAARDEAIRGLVERWAAQDAALVIDDVRLRGPVVIVDVTGPEEPPAIDDLVEGLAVLLEQTIDVEVRWVERTGTFRATASPPSTTTTSTVPTTSTTVEPGAAA